MDIDGDGEAAELSSRQVQVRFITKLKPPYKAPQASISIPANLTRFGLSALVNNLLQAGFFFFIVLLFFWKRLSKGTELNECIQDRFRSMTIIC